MIDNNLSFLNSSAPLAARQLLGCVLVRTVNKKTLRVRIVETEAYDETDAASHSFKGETQRTKVMFGESGHLYVYFTYGMHYCCNVVVGGAGEGAAVLIRAVEPVAGEALMELSRGGRGGTSLTNGPAKICQALSIDSKLNGHDLHRYPLVLQPGKLTPKEAIGQTTRIGISRAKDKPWRFFIKDNPYVSKGI